VVQISGTRRNVAAGNGSLHERSLAIADVVKAVAIELHTTPSRVAIAWTLQNRAVVAPILGVRTMAQLEDNLGALDIELPSAALARLDDASRVELGFPHDFLKRPLTRAVVRAGAKVAPRR
jgi:aryl-alcohol dehydrogenase-like predicted oxidoreductase